MRLYRESDPKSVIRKLAEQLCVIRRRCATGSGSDEADRGERDDRPSTDTLLPGPGDWDPGEWSSGLGTGSRKEELLHLLETCLPVLARGSDKALLQPTCDDLEPGSVQRPRHRCELGHDVGAVSTQYTPPGMRRRVLRSPRHIPGGVNGEVIYHGRS